MIKIGITGLNPPQPGRFVISSEPNDRKELFRYCFWVNNLIRSGCPFPETKWENSELFLSGVDPVVAGLVRWSSKIEDAEKIDLLEKILKEDLIAAIKRAKEKAANKVNFATLETTLTSGNIQTIEDLIKVCPKDKIAGRKLGPERLRLLKEIIKTELGLELG